MIDEWKQENFLSYKWQYKTLSGGEFFGSPESSAIWARRSDYPIRFFLWKINREAWADFHFRSLSEHNVVEAAATLRRLLSAISTELAEAAGRDFPEESEPKSFRQAAVQELDSDEVLLECLEQDDIDELCAKFGVPLAWTMFGSLMALLHVDDCVSQLDHGDVAMAAAFALRAQYWQANGHFEDGRRTSEWLHKKRLAESGADAAHQENRRVRAMALETYAGRKWPSKMQAARVISKQVNRTELVVLRWIREHTKADREGGTLPAK